MRCLTCSYWFIYRFRFGLRQILVPFETLKSYQHSILSECVNMNIWLCPVKPGSWRIVKNTKIFGAPRRASKMIRQVKPNDLLIFHVLKPVNGIVCVGRVVSEVFEDNEDIWGKDRYPLRVRMEFIPALCRDRSNPIPISSLFGSPSTNEITVEPYLKGVWITKVSKRQYSKLKMILKKRRNAKSAHHTRI
jgi:hypothetical protein